MLSVSTAGGEDTFKRSILSITLNYIWLWGSTYEDPGSMKNPFIAITPCFIMTLAPLDRAEGYTDSILAEG